MKKIILFLQMTSLLFLSNNVSFASGGDGHGRSRHWDKHHRHHDEHYSPPGQYYGPGYSQPSYQDPRSHQGLAGGVVGSVIGYELGKGDPIATGIGAAAGSLIGNKVSGGR